VRRPWRKGRPFARNEQVETKHGVRRTGRIVAFDRDCTGARAALVLWSDGSEQLCLTADLQRPGCRRAPVKLCAYCGGTTTKRLKLGVCPRCAAAGIEA
jgi:hypothetical protein